MDLLFFHRKLRCLVIIDLKLGSLTHADVGQMHMYCNYAKEHLGLRGREPAGGADSVCRQGPCLGAVCAGWLADLGDGGELSDGVAGYRVVAKRTGEHATFARIT